MPVQTDLRDSVLDAAERLLGRYGYRKMTMDDIAQEAGIGRRTIYLHFEGKEDVALSTIDRIVERVADSLRKIARSDSAPAERLKDMLTCRVMERIDRVHDYYQSLDDILSSRRPAYMARRETYLRTETALIAQVLEEGRAQGDFRFEDPEETASAMLMATNALLPYSLTVKELGARNEVEARVKKIAELLIHGISS